MRVTIKCTIVLLSIFGLFSLHAQDKKKVELVKKDTATYEKEGPLKGLRKLGDDEMQGTQIMLDGESIPVYLDGKKVKGMELMTKMSSGDYVPTPYANKDGEVKAVVLKAATEEEKEMMRKMFAGEMPEDQDVTPKDVVYEKEGPLKGLRKLQEEEMYFMQNEIDEALSDTNKTPVYNAEGKKVSEEKLDEVLMSPEYVLDFYVDENKKIKAATLRMATEEEKQAMEAMVVGAESAMEARMVDVGNNFTAKPATPFSVKDIEGNEYSLNSLKGKVIVMNFWFIGCKPCQQEIPELNELVEKYHGKEVVFLGFALDKKSRLQTFLKKKPFNYNIIPGSKLDSSYEVYGYPTHVVINQNSEIVWRTSGLSPITVSMLDNTIESLIK